MYACVPLSLLFAFRSWKVYWCGFQTFCPQYMFPSSTGLIKPFKLVVVKKYNKLSCLQVASFLRFRHPCKELLMVCICASCFFIVCPSPASPIFLKITCFCYVGSICVWRILLCYWCMHAPLSPFLPLEVFFVAVFKLRALTISLLTCFRTRNVPSLKPFKLVMVKEKLMSCLRVAIVCMYASFSSNCSNTHVPENGPYLCLLFASVLVALFSCHLTSPCHLPCQLSFPV